MDTAHSTHHWPLLSGWFCWTVVSHWCRLVHASPSAFCRRTAQLLRDTISRVSVASQTTCCQKCYFRTQISFKFIIAILILMLMIAGKQNCSWSSCREGCTKEIFNCWQVVLLLVLLVLLVSLVSLPSTHSECNVDEDEQFDAVLLSDIRLFVLSGCVSCIRVTKESPRICRRVFPIHGYWASFTLALPQSRSLTESASLSHFSTWAASSLK